LTLTGASHGGNIGRIGGDLTLCNCVTGGLTIDGGSLRVNGFTSIFGGTLAVTNGGVLNSRSGAGIDTAMATVTGPGSTWNIRGFFGLAVGGFGPGALTISNGGVVNVVNGITTIGDLSVGSSKVTVTGPGSVLNAFNGLQIGGGCGCNPVGTLTIADGGLVNSPTGTAIGAGSTLNLGIGGLAGAIVTPFIINNGLIAANFTDTLSLATPISGAGALNKSGAGTLILTAENTYTGPTNVNGGTLEVDGSIANSSIVNVNSGGTLSGTGIVDPAMTTIGAGGTLAPGNAANPTGTLTITGNLAFQSGALYLIQVTPGSASSTSVAGTATLTGTVQAVFAPGIYIPATYTILHSAGLNGTTFSSLSANVPANFLGTLSYTPTDVLLNLIPQLGVNAGAFFNLNQQAVANATTASSTTVARCRLGSSGYLASPAPISPMRLHCFRAKPPPALSSRRSS
jgi:autotransporter-associated beta strand protein/T5SS/PEP-CTERM-associated repeat protein